MIINDKNVNKHIQLASTLSSLLYIHFHWSVVSLSGSRGTIADGPQKRSGTQLKRSGCGWVSWVWLGLIGYASDWPLFFPTLRPAPVVPPGSAVCCPGLGVVDWAPNTASRAHGAASRDESCCPQTWGSWGEELFQNGWLNHIKPG